MNMLIDAPVGLEAVVALLEQLNDEGVRYCHWKSTCRLPQSLAGRTDLDLLIDRGHARRFKAILYQHDFKPFVSHPQRQYPAIEDYLGFDQATGRLIHLHIHYRLVLGEQFAKNYYLPLEQCFLGHSEWRLGVRTPAAELEIIVLALRALLKYRDRDALADMLGLGRTSGIPPAILDEFRYLFDQTTPERIERARQQHVGFVPADLLATFLATIRASPRAGRTLYRLRQRVRRELAPYQRQSRLLARCRYWRAALARQWPLSRLLRRFSPDEDKRKIPALGGATVAFIGADGAGKSTIIARITRWLSWRMIAYTFYMGSSQPSLVTRALKGAAGLARLGHTGCQRLFGERSRPTLLAAGLARLLTSLRYLSDGRDRCRRYLAGRRKAAQGAIVIYDRYPLAGAQIFNRTIDGPRIAALCGNQSGPLITWLAQAEERFYRQILPPDHIFALHVGPDVAQTRKPGHRRAAIEAKSQAIDRLANDSAELTHIDAEQPLDQVVLQIQSALWQLI